MKKSKKTYRPDAVYKRTQSGKYIDIGMEFRGFPSDGIFLVQDGRNNMTCLIGSKESVSIFALNYHLHEQGIVDMIQKRQKEGGVSLYDVARIAADYFAKEAEKLKIKGDKNV